MRTSQKKSVIEVKKQIGLIDLDLNTTISTIALNRYVPLKMQRLPD